MPTSATTDLGDGGRLARPLSRGISHGSIKTPGGAMHSTARSIRTTTTAVSVIGGAIAGPAAALRLATLGHEVTVYEQRPADALFSAGILGITPGNWTWVARRSAA